MKPASEVKAFVEERTKPLFDEMMKKVEDSVTYNSKQGFSSCSFNTISWPSQIVTKVKRELVALGYKVAMDSYGYGMVIMWK